MKKYDKNAQKIGNIMEINVNSSSKRELLTRLENYLTHNIKFSVVTPNPELILMAQTNKGLKNALNSATLSIPDGVGLKLAIPSLNIIKGRELFLDLIKLAAERDWKVFLLGGLDEEAQIASQKLQILHPKLRIRSDQGPKLDSDAHPITKNDAEIEKMSIERINKFKPDLLFVAYGAPRQEIWVHEHLSKLNIKGAMCVGGTFRYIAGLSKLPPKWMARSLEWLWRLFTEPMRIGRIFRAVIIFPLKCFLNKVRSS